MFLWRNGVRKNNIDTCCMPLVQTIKMRMRLWESSMKSFQIFQKMNQNIKPLAQTILIYYLDSYDGEMNFHLRQQYPQKL